MSDSPGLVDFAIGLVNFWGHSIYIECLLSTGFEKIILKGLKVTKFDIHTSLKLLSVTLDRSLNITVQHKSEYKASSM